MIALIFRLTFLIASMAMQIAVALGALLGHLIVLMGQAVARFLASRRNAGPVSPLVRTSAPKPTPNAVTQTPQALKSEFRPRPAFRVRPRRPTKFWRR